MRARSSVLCLVAALLAPTAAAAESGPTRAATLGLTAVQPLPPWKDAGLGLAPWAGFIMPAWRDWKVTGRAGWIGHLDKEQNVGSESIRYQNWELPVLAGIEYSPAGERGLLFSAELGYVLQHTRAEYLNEPAATATDHGGGIAVGGGYRINGLQIRVQYFMFGLPDPAKQKALMFGVRWSLPM